MARKKSTASSPPQEPSYSDWKRQALAALAGHDGGGAVPNLKKLDAGERV